jgi:hypothetical protein
MSSAGAMSISSLSKTYSCIHFEILTAVPNSNAAFGETTFFRARIIAWLFAASLLQTNLASAQTTLNQGSRGNCSPNVNAQGNVTIVCPNNSPGVAGPPPQRSHPGGPGGRMRNGEFIPTCPVGMGFSLRHRVCIPAQQVEGTIPCSEDDAKFIGSGWVPNCGPFRQ